MTVIRAELDLSEGSQWLRTGIRRLEGWAVSGFEP